jgi:probable phosphoglycerate mutase
MRAQTAQEPLSKEGIGQAKKIAKRLVKLPVDVVYASPMVRAKTTAEIISKKIKKEVELWEPLHEVLRPSSVHGLHVNDSKAKKINNLLIEKFLDTSFRHSDEEIFPDINSRAEKVLSHLLKHHRHQNVLCVSHGTFTKVLVAKIIFGDELTPEIFRSMRYHMHMENTGITHCEYSDKYGWNLITWNDSTHL